MFFPVAVILSLFSYGKVIHTSSPAISVCLAKLYCCSSAAPWSKLHHSELRTTFIPFGKGLYAYTHSLTAKEGTLQYTPTVLGSKVLKKRWRRGENVCQVNPNNCKPFFAKYTIDWSPLICAHVCVCVSVCVNSCSCDTLAFLPISVSMELWK